MSKRLPNSVHLDRWLLRWPIQICHHHLHGRTLYWSIPRQFPRQRWIWCPFDLAVELSNIWPNKPDEPIRVQLKWVSYWNNQKNKTINTKTILSSIAPQAIFDKLANLTPSFIWIILIELLSVNSNWPEKRERDKRPWASKCDAQTLEVRFTRTKAGYMM